MSASSGSRIPPVRPGFARQPSRDGNNNGPGSPSSLASPRFDEGPPSRPERSVRRPLNTPSPSTMGLSGGRFPDNGLDRQGSITSLNSVAGASGGGGAFRDNGFGNGNHRLSQGAGPPIVTIGNTRLENINASSPESSPQLGSGRRGGGGGTFAGAGSGSKSRRMMDKLNNNSATSSPELGGSSPRLAPSAAVAVSNSRNRRPSRRDSGSSDMDGSLTSASSSRAGSPNRRGEDEEDEEEDENGEPKAAPEALTAAISAFSSAGQRRDGRRGGVADQGFDVKPVVAKAKSSALNPAEYPKTPAFREIDSVLHKVQAEWPVLMYGTTATEGEEDAEKDFDPVTLALGLLDPSQEGGPNSLQSFLKIKAELDRAITGTMTTNKSEFRAYESSITTYKATLASIGSSQRQVLDLKKRLGDAREKLEGKGREGLAGMYNRMSHLEEMVKILDEIDHLRSIPDRLESLMSDKRFVSAVVLLVRSLKTINKPEMMEIGALTDLRSWLVHQEVVLLEILIEELHNHLYLKSFYCDARWKAYTRGQTALPLVDFGEDVQVVGPASHLEASFHTSGRSRAKLPQLSKLQRYLNALSLQPSSNPLLDEPTDDVTLDEDDATASANLYEGAGSFSLPTLESSMDAAKTKRTQHKNPELDSFVYIETLMESLACLGKLGVGLDAISQRIQSEMFNLVEATIEEVEERNDPKQGSSFRPTPGLVQTTGTLATMSSSSLSLSYASTRRSSLLRLTASETTELEMNVEILKDLFWTLFSKLDAVLQGFRVTYEVAMRIAERRDFKDSSAIKASSGSMLFSLLEVWKPVQQEVRSLLHDYLTDDHSGSVSSRNPIVSVNEVLRLARPRDGSKQIFKFGDSDLKSSTKALKVYEDDLNRSLKAAVPGLVMDNAANAGQLLIVTDERYGGGRSGPGGSHKALVKADAFNVSVLFAPTWAFLERVRSIMPGGLLGDDDVGSFGGFLDDFVLKTFLPQLEEKVTSVFHQAVGGHEAFQEDPNYKKLSPVPIVKSVSNLMVLISNLCTMLRATPFHRESYSHLIVSVIHQFYQRCQERFKDLTARDPTPVAPTTGNSRPAPVSPLKTSATWADDSEINQCMAELRGIPPEDQARLKECLQQETKIELEKKGHGGISSDDLISPSKKLIALGTLYSSLDWFISYVAMLKTSPDSGPSAMGVNSFAFDESPELGQGEFEDDEETLPLPLTPEMALPFETLVKSYRHLALLVLFTLRLEIRLRTMHHLDKATRDGVYQLAEDTAEPDPSVVELNSDLAECDECAAVTLAPPERRFIFEGLSSLMDQLLISNARNIRLANKFGQSKMMRNILALQQNLKNIGESPLDVNFDRSRKFWEVFGQGPVEMLNQIRNKSISYDWDDYKTLLNLQCQVDQSSKDVGGDGTPLLNSSGGGGGLPGDDRSRKLYNMHLIELFALDTGHEQ